MFRSAQDQAAGAGGCHFQRRTARPRAQARRRGHEEAMRVRTASKAMYGTADGNTADRRPFATQTAVPRNAGAPDDSFEDMFDLAPVSLWLEDYSGLKDLLEQWQADGMTDLRATPARAAGARGRVLVAHPRGEGQPAHAGTVRGRRASITWSPTCRGCSATTCSTSTSRNWCGCGRAATASARRRSTTRSPAQRLDILLDGRVLPGHETHVGPRAGRDRGRDRDRARATATSRAASATRAACSSIRRYRCGSRTSARSRRAWTRCGRRASPTSASSSTCIRSSSPAACARSA